MTTVWFGDPGTDEPRTVAAPVVAPVTNEPRSSAPECPRAVRIIRRRPSGLEEVRMPLLDCDGSPREEARLALSVLARPRSVEAAPTAEAMQAWADADGDPELVAEGVHWLHPGLLERLQAIGEAFAPSAIEIVSGYRPDASVRSRHHHGRALDLAIDGAPREALRDLALTFPQTGVGWYPNSTFVHVDVREESTYWVDLSGPGEAPRYVREGTPSPTEGPEGEGLERSPGVPPPRPRRPVPSRGSVAREDLERMRRETEEALRALQIPIP